MKAVFFDATGTLIHLPRGVGYHYALVAERFGIALDPKNASRAFLQAWKEMPSRPATRQPREDDDRGWWRILVSRVLALHGREPNEKFFETLYAHFAEPGVWELHPEVAEVLAALAGKYRLGIISNFDGRLRKILADLGIESLFTAICISSEVGADKPDRFIFDCALDRLGIAASEALHAGDDPVHDWAGASAAGLHVFRLDREHNSLRDLLPPL